MITDKSHIIGRAAEYFVCYDLSKRGIRASLSPFEQAPYDILAEHNGRLITIQVKGTAKPHRPCQYRFTFSKRVESDLLALVALDSETIHYRTVDGYKSSLWIPVAALRVNQDEALINTLKGDNLTNSSPNILVESPETLIDTSVSVIPKTD